LFICHWLFLHSFLQFWGRKKQRKSILASKWEYRNNLCQWPWYKTQVNTCLNRSIVYKDHLLLKQVKIKTQAINRQSPGNLRLRAICFPLNHIKTGDKQTNKPYFKPVNNLKLFACLFGSRSHQHCKGHLVSCSSFIVGGKPQVSCNHVHYFKHKLRADTGVETPTCSKLGWIVTFFTCLVEFQT
jgi:hypothetical protein